MNSRERYLATAHYAERDRLYHWEMGPYDETARRWRNEGLPADSRWDDYGGYDRFDTAPVHVGLCPGFDVETLKEEGDYVTYRDSDGVIKKRRKDVVYPAMPQYLEYPLKGRVNGHHSTMVI